MRVIDDPTIGKSERFAPDWRSPPGDTIADLLEEKGWTPDEFADRMEYTPDHARRVLDGTAIITDNDAARMERVIGGSTRFWIEREAQYRASQIDTGNPADIGEWGAWRAVLAEMCEDIDDPDNCYTVEWFLELVGWSP